MLKEILKQFREAGGPLDLNALARKLNVERSALEGMLTTLVRQGKLREVEIGSADCRECRSRLTCAYLAGGAALGKVYELPQGQHRGGER
jgi:predicted transcriptional regulator